MYKLVVIDDEYIVVEGIKSMIARLGLPYEVVDCAYDGINGLDVIIKNNPDLVITDIRIPGMDGLSLIESAQDYCPNTFFVIISGYTDFTYAKKALVLGAKDYIDKPISMDKLKDLLTRIENDFLKTKIKNIEQSKKQQGYIKLEDALKSGMSAITGGDTEKFNKSSIKAWNALENMYTDINDLHRESYKLLCIFCDILSEQQKDFHREDFISYNDMTNLIEISKLKEYFNQVTSEIAQHIEADNTGATHKIILQILNYVKENYNKDIGLNELADMVKMNPAYLSSLFKEEVGMSYIKYLTDLRIQHAKRLLNEGHRVNEVSSMVGYNNYRHFGSIFKKNVGKTPNEYKGVTKTD